MIGDRKIPGNFIGTTDESIFSTDDIYEHVLKKMQCVNPYNCSFIHQFDITKVVGFNLFLTDEKSFIHEINHALTNSWFLKIILDSNDENIWAYWGEKTKETTFLPSLVSNKRQIAFILNMESDYAKQMAVADVWNTELSEETLIEFLDYRYYPKFIDLRFSKDATTTDRESSIMFGLPLKLVEGVFVGREIEADATALKYIKSKLSDCYICNLDGKVIVE